MQISRSTMELSTAMVTAIAGVVISWGSLANGIGWNDTGPEGGFFPFYVGCLVIIGSLVNAARAISAGAGSPPSVDRHQLAAVTRFALPVFGFVLISTYLGLYIGMGVYIFATTRAAAGFRTVTALATALIVVAVNFILFEKIFVVPLMKGPLLNHFGIY